MCAFRSGSKFIIAHDVGSSGDKAVITDLNGKTLSSSYVSYNMLYPGIGLVEQDPDVLWDAVVQTTKQLLSDSGIDPANISGIGISSQMFNLIPVDEDFNPITRMITWMDLRGLNQAENIYNHVSAEKFCQWTGNVPNAKDIIPKILWLKEAHPDLWEKTYKLLDCKEYLIYKLTGKCAIDWHGASVFMLFDPINKTWSNEACAALGIPIEKLPEPFPCTEVVGEVLPNPAKEMHLSAGTPVVICAGDVGVAQVGAGTVSAGRANLYIGTGGWIGVSSKKIVNDPKSPFWALCHVDPEGWIIATDLDTAGGSLMWFSEKLCQPEIEQGNLSGTSVYQVLDEMASEIEPGSENLLFFPWLSGERGHLGVGHDAKGAFVGLSFGHGKAHMARAIMEGVAYYYRWMLEAIEQAGVEVKTIRAIGGGCKSINWIQIMSDILNREMEVVENPQEAGSLGAALTVSVGLGYHESLQSVEPFIPVGNIVIPRNDIRQSRYDNLYREYREIGSQLLPHYSRLSATS